MTDSAVLGGTDRSLTITSAPSQFSCDSTLRARFWLEDAARWTNEFDVPHVQLQFQTDDGNFVFGDPEEFVRERDPQTGRWGFVREWTDLSMPHDALVRFQIVAQFPEPDPGPVGVELTIVSYAAG